MQFSVRKHFGFLLLLLLPGMLLVGALIILPLLNGVRLSFTNASPLHSGERWVGLDNFVFLLEDPVFWEVVRNSVVLVAVSILLATGLGFVIALLLNTGIAGANFFRTAIFQVWVVPWIVVAILWSWLFNSDYGLVNHLLKSAGLMHENFKWLFDPLGAQTAIIFAFTWRSIPFMMVVSLAALQGIPRELLESAAIDGAGYFRQLFFIVLPLLRNILLVVALLQTVRLFQELTLPWVLTGGGPVNATMVLSMYSYQLAFSNWDFGLASTVGTLWLGVVIVFSALYMRVLVRGIH